MTSNNQSSSSSSTPEEILVLYGSQTGNSEGAAEELTALIPQKLSTSSTSPNNTNTPCTARCMHLDDFLEIEKAKWPRLVVIVCSSYGVGQAPIGARKFREFCDELLERYDGEDNKQGTKNNNNKMLEGVNFALLGLGDSHYTTYFQNPTTIHKALTTVGATHVGELGKADASGIGNDEQCKVIERWIANIWKDLEKVVTASNAPEQETLDKACDDSWKLCMEIFPEWKPAKNIASMAALYLPLGGVLVAIGAHFFLSGSWT